MANKRDFSLLMGVAKICTTGNDGLRVPGWHGNGKDAVRAHGSEQ